MSSLASFRGEGEYGASGYDSGIHVPVSGGDDMDPSLGECSGPWCLSNFCRAIKD